MLSVLHLVVLGELVVLHLDLGTVKPFGDGVACRLVGTHARVRVRGNGAGVSGDGGEGDHARAVGSPVPPLVYQESKSPHDAHDEQAHEEPNDAGSRCRLLGIVRGLGDFLVQEILQLAYGVLERACLCLLLPLPVRGWRPEDKWTVVLGDAPDHIIGWQRRTWARDGLHKLWFLGGRDLDQPVLEGFLPLHAHEESGDFSGGQGRVEQGQVSQHSLKVPLGVHVIPPAQKDMPVQHHGLTTVDIEGLADHLLLSGRGQKVRASQDPVNKYGVALTTVSSRGEGDHVPSIVVHIDVPGRVSRLVVIDQAIRVQERL
mmetsp:Transcript_9535/g.27126  ORF Transcript_9535/g.27126 Transcript_9535/m.27126 type:complete len:316 (+) Transcript_9535:366-1313(+)